MNDPPSGRPRRPEARNRQAPPPSESRERGSAGGGRPEDQADPPEIISFQITEPGPRLDRCVAEHLSVSRTRAAALIADGLVLVDGEPVRKSRAAVPGETVTVSLPPEPPLEVAPQEIPVPVVYEDDDLAVVDKPAGMVVHPAPGHPDGTLVNALLHRLGGLSPVGAPLRPGIVHRLDRDTSGLLVVARTEEAHRVLATALSRRRVRRGYLAAAWGKVEPGDGTIDRPVGRDPRNRKRMAVVESGRRAVTHYRRLERWPSADYLALRLETGRTHQVRVHLRDAGHPVVGDPIYARGWERGFVGAGGRWAEEFSRVCGRMFLHAARLVFRHPVTGERMAFTSPLPEPLRDAVRWAREAR